MPQFLHTYFKMDIGYTDIYSLYKDKFFDRLVLDRLSTIIGSHCKTLFPPPDSIKALYDDERIWMLPVNYVRFMKWRVGDWVKG